ncbi:hypothetical protein FB566_4869 [Stackebrandtia endophytica]|uniref:Uncharacterized protein n=1 Tax=Stackebrandtia endophytica TaxID=1496996 RepID=A0A543B347_9ACTN|nr:hypothetical protein [Stackebrandtia endophytica]TQL79268.1 hypothetical protein FB566_4869 [Stackebrandtia endophytica]
MLHRSAWIRSLTAVLAWSAVTSVAALGTWLSLAAVLPVGSDRLDADTLVAAEASSAPPPTEAPTTSSPEPEPDPTTSTPDPEPLSSFPDEKETPEQHDGWTWVTENTYEGRFTTEGGTAVVQVNPDEAVLISASPAEGYTADIDQAQADRLLIYFSSSATEVVIDTMWWDGPYAEISTQS